MNFLPRYRIVKDLWVFAELKYFGMNRSDFNILSVEKKLNPPQSWQLPDYFIVDAGVSYAITLKNKSKFNLILSIANIADQHYISQSMDGILHNRESASVLYGIGRSFSAGLKYEF
jgi:outer membrane receptor protein involved in Fe transport